MAAKEVKFPVNELQIGHSIRLPLSWKEHPFMFSAFCIKDPKQIALIRKLGLTHVFLQVKEGEPSPTEKPTKQLAPEPIVDIADEIMLQEQQETERRIESTKAYRKKVKACEKTYSRSLDLIKGGIAKIGSNPDKAYADVSVVVDELVKQFGDAGDDVILQLVAANQQDAISFHSLNVCVVAMVLGRALELSDPLLRELGTAALIHDAGKVRIPGSILNKKQSLTKQERNFVNQHPKYTAEMIKGTPFDTKSIRAMVLGHHEYLDGSGYPSRLKGNQISAEAQILAIANEYDGLIASHHRSLVPSQAMAYMFKNRSKQLNVQYLQALIKAMGIYPPGSLLRFDNEQIGRVLSSEDHKALFPTVLLYDAEIPRSEAPMLNLEELDLKVTSVLHANDLTEDQARYLEVASSLSYYVR